MPDAPRAALMAALRTLYAEAARVGATTDEEDAADVAALAVQYFDARASYSGSLARVLAAVDASEAVARKPEARCPWMEDEWGTWTTGCGRKWQYEVGGPADNDARYCHGCGGVIEAAPYGEPTERSPDA